MDYHEGTGDKMIGSTQTAKQEESRLFKVLRLGDNPSDQDIQVALDRLFVEKQNEDRVSSALSTYRSTRLLRD